MIGRLLCRWGFHDWRYFPQVWTFYQCFENDKRMGTMVSRRCTRCPRMEMTTKEDNGKWSQRL